MNNKKSGDDTKTQQRKKSLQIDSINSINKIANDKTKIYFFRKILQIFDSLHDYKDIFKNNEYLIDKILYDNNIGNNTDIKDKINCIFRGSKFEEKLLKSLTNEKDLQEKSIKSYNRSNDGKIVSIFNDINKEVIADANKFFNKSEYCTDTELKEYMPHYSIATQHDYKGENKCGTQNKDDNCYKCSIKNMSEINLDKNFDGLLIIEQVKLKDGTEKDRYIKYKLNNKWYKYNDNYKNKLGMSKFIAICDSILNNKNKTKTIKEIEQIIYELYNLNIDIFNKNNNNKEKNNINYVRSLLDIKRLGDLLQIKVAQHNNYLFITGDQTAFLISTLGYNTQALYSGSKNSDVISSKVIRKSRDINSKFLPGTSVVDSFKPSRNINSRNVNSRSAKGGFEVEVPHNIKNIYNMNNMNNNIEKFFSKKDIIDMYNKTLTKLIKNISEDKDKVGNNTVFAFEFMFVADIFLTILEHSTEEKEISVKQGLTTQKSKKKDNINNSSSTEHARGRGNPPIRTRTRRTNQYANRVSGGNPTQ